ncbi:DUF1643 domain-containing protein [Bosea massiliensis]|uniref:DUF1643 domain-containing protein n=1 Tax=Bosea massiliensis TaxID=151419 RepID=A0ABW0PBY4_9HYPH
MRGLPIYNRAAIISDCGRFRYRLARTWDSSKTYLQFAMLNPSTADAEIDDPTIRRCVAFARREGFGGIDVINLHAYRAMRPEELKHVDDRDGPENERYLRYVAEYQASVGGQILCAWGATGDVFSGASRALDTFKAAGARTVCLGKTANGMPRHPLYVPGDQPLEPYERS